VVGREREWNGLWNGSNKELLYAIMPLRSARIRQKGIKDESITRSSSRTIFERSLPDSPTFPLNPPVTALTIAIS
jgi:hypothetical protein